MALKNIKRGETKPPVDDLPQVPAVTSAPDGAIMVSTGKYARNAVMTAFEMIGGVNRMAEWADENPGEFYTKLFGKTITREVEQTKSDDLEGLLEAIDAEVEVVDVESESVE